MAPWQMLEIRYKQDDLDGGWIAECPALPGCISQGETLIEAVFNLLDAIDGVTAANGGRR